MSNLRQAAQAALEALTESVDLVQHDYDNDWRHGMPTRAGQLKGSLDALNAHKAAIDALRAALAEPQPEPVAWAHRYSDDGPLRTLRDSELDAIDDVAIVGGTARVVPLYAAPQAQHPLTDKQIDAAYCESQNQDLRPQDKSRVFAFARAIERAHGIGK